MSGKEKPSISTHCQALPSPYLNTPEALTITSGPLSTDFDVRDDDDNDDGGDVARRMIFAGKLSASSWREEEARREGKQKQREDRRPLMDWWID